MTNDLGKLQKDAEEEHAQAVVAYQEALKAWKREKDRSAPKPEKPGPAARIDRLESGLSEAQAQEKADALNAEEKEREEKKKRKKATASRS